MLQPSSTTTDQCDSSRQLYYNNKCMCPDEREKFRRSKSPNGCIAWSNSAFVSRQRRDAKASSQTKTPVALQISEAKRSDDDASSHHSQFDNDNYHCLAASQRNQRYLTCCTRCERSEGCLARRAVIDRRAPIQRPFASTSRCRHATRNKKSS